MYWYIVWEFKENKHSLGMVLAEHPFEYYKRNGDTGTITYMREINYKEYCLAKECEIEW